MAWSLDMITQESKGKIKCQSGRSVPQQRNLRGTDRWQRLLQGDRWCSSKGRQPRENLRQVEQQLMPVRNSQIKKIQERAGKWSDNIWTTSPKQGLWEAYTMAWYTRQFQFQKPWRYRSQSRCGYRMECFLFVFQKKKLKYSSVGM